MWLKSDFDETYQCGAEPWGHPGSRREVRLSYHRCIWFARYEQRAESLIKTLTDLGVSKHDRILIVGAGFGWTAEHMEKKGWYDIVCTDISPWIQEQQDQSEEDDIDEAIRKVGLDPASGEGAEVKSRLYNPGPRCRLSRRIRDEDIRLAEHRGRLGIFDAVICESVNDPEVLASASLITNIVIHGIEASGELAWHVSR